MFYKFQRALHRQIVLFSKIMKKRRVKKSLIWKTETVLLKRKSYKCRGNRAKRRNWRRCFITPYLREFPILSSYTIERHYKGERHIMVISGETTLAGWLWALFSKLNLTDRCSIWVSLCVAFWRFFENIETNSFNGCDSLSIHRSSGSKLC